MRILCKSVFAGCDSCTGVQVHQKNQVARPILGYSLKNPYLRDMTAHPTENAIKLSSLTQWSQEHVRAIFESSTNEEFIQAVEETFSSDIKATVNGKQVGRHEIKQSALSLRAESPGGLRVEWKHTVELPQDAYNRVIFFWTRPRSQVFDLLQNGSFGGFYVIHNIHRRIAGGNYDNTVKIERHKAVTVVLVVINSFFFRLWSLAIYPESNHNPLIQQSTAVRSSTWSL